jgi:signal transduction histidine kinase
MCPGHPRAILRTVLLRDWPASRYQDRTLGFVATRLRRHRRGFPGPGARILQAADEERRRIAQDLHDGLQGRLVLLAMRAHALQADESAPAGVRSEAAALGSGLQGAIAELRELVHGVMPAALAERGLFAAAREIADQTPIPVELEMEGSGQSLPGPVETTGYFVLAEALTNAVKHSGARELVVRVRHGDGRLRIEVCDDGVGGAQANGGAGLRGMADRVGALGGRVAVDSPCGRGTRVMAEVPCGS